MYSFARAPPIQEFDDFIRCFQGGAKMIGFIDKTPVDYFHYLHIKSFSYLYSAPRRMPTSCWRLLQCPCCRNSWKVPGFGV